ncbi:MAG: hypothetical protein KGJ84_11700 [Elusimicrobia bacterium]|nr:hypothetical protein [Elusimicrobiota bacterium]
MASSPRVDPYRVPIVPGCFLAMRKDTFVRTGGFDPGMSTWGMSDIEMSIRFNLLGYRLLVVPEVSFTTPCAWPSFIFPRIEPSGSSMPSVVTPSFPRPWRSWRRAISKSAVENFQRFGGTMTNGISDHLPTVFLDPDKDLTPDVDAVL